MPRSILINDPRPRTRTITIDLSDPERYTIEVIREKVEELEDGRIISREATMLIREEVTFTEKGEPIGSKEVLGLLGPIQAAIETIEARRIVEQEAMLKARNDPANLV